MTRLVVALVWLMPALALADAVGIPAEACPDGSTRRIAGHGGSWCEPLACGGTATCAGTCREIALCTGTGTHYVEHGHLATSPPPTPAEHLETYGACPLIGDCERGTCTRETRCVEGAAPPPSPSSPRPSSSSACSASPGDRGALASVIVLGALVSFTRRRRGTP